MTKPAKKLSIFQSELNKSISEGKKSAFLSQIKEDIHKTNEDIYEAFKSHDCKSLITTILKSPIHTLSHSTELHTSIINSFQEPQHKLEIFTALSKKLAKDYTKVKEITELNFYALTKFHHAQSIIKIYPNIEKEPLGDALTLLTDANIIIQKNSLKLKITSNTAIDTVICNRIESYGASGIEYSKEQALTFAEDSLERQQKNLSKNHPSILKLLLTTAKMKYDFDLDVARNTASRINDSTPEAKALRLEEALKYAEEASDMASRLDDSNSKMKAIQLAVKICSFHGNYTLADSFEKQSSNQPTYTLNSPKRKLSEENYDSWEGKYDPSDDFTENKKPKENNETTDVKEEMTDIITKLLKEEVFGKITEIINSGTWNTETEKKLINLVSDEYLTSSSALYKSDLEQTPTAANDTLHIIRTLAFKTLAEAIVKQESTNYAPILNFAQAYPDIIKKITKNHPEYLLENPTITNICVKTPELVESCKDGFEEIRQSEKNPYKLIMDRIEKLEALIGYTTTPTSDEDFLQGALPALTEDDLNAMFSSVVA